MTIHFTADLHLDHESVLAMSGRLFRNILEHDNAMIDQINRYVSRDDRLFILGDVAWHSVENYLNRIVCKDVHLIWGNHDKHSYGKYFKSQQDVLEIKIGQKPNQHKVFLSHYPHAYWPASHHGAFHLYGHCHRQREETLDEKFPGRRSLDVGVDNALHLLGQYRPFNEHEIIEILGSRPGHDQISFYEDFQSKLPKYRRGSEEPTMGQFIRKEKVTLVNNDDGDWEGIYVNGTLQTENHSLAACQVLEALGIEYQQLTVRMDPYEFNQLPEMEEELPKQ